MRIRDRFQIAVWSACLLFGASSAWSDEPASPSDLPPTPVREEPALPELSAEGGEAACQQIASDWNSGSCCDSCCDAGCCGGSGCCNRRRLIVSLIQTAGYGTNLTLPLTLTPLNTLVSPLGLPSQGQILNSTNAVPLGLADNFGLVPGVIADAPNRPVFEDDFQFQTTASGAYQLPVGDDATFTTGYGYYQSLHADVQQLDISSHTATAQYARQLSDRLVGTLDYAYSYYFLNDDSFVSQHRPGVGLLLRQSPQWDFQVRGEYADANFRNARFLNSDNYGARTEAIRYLFGTRTNYLTFGSSVGYSDAVLRGVSYQVYNSYVGGRFLFGADQRNELRLNGGYGIYDFFGTDPLAGIARQDKLFNATASVARYHTEYFSTFAAYTYLDSDSNLDRQAYDSDLISIGAAYNR